MAGEQAVAELFLESVTIMARLRAPGGCPWDREQTPDSIRKYTLEETYEVLDAIERRDWENLEEELGDLLLQVLFFAQMARDEGHFTLDGVLKTLNRKLIRRHPHVFGEVASAEAGNRAADLAAVGSAQNGRASAASSVSSVSSLDGSAAVLANWQRIKQLEKREEGSAPSGYLAGVLRAQPALAEAAKLGSAAARAGFDWPDPAGLLEKVREEASEVEAELAALQAAGGPQTRAHLAEEVGDLLFTVANLARHLKVDPEMALRDANAKFRRRFEQMEAAHAAAGSSLEDLSSAELEVLWAAAKAAEGQPA